MIKIVLLIIIIFSSIESILCSLKFIIIFHRHGARTPKHFYRESYWDVGASELTQLGASQLYELGQQLRKKYVMKKQFLPENLTNSQIIQAFSSESKRCQQRFYLNLMFIIKSLQQLLYGLYPYQPNQDQLPSNQLSILRQNQIKVIIPEKQNDLLFHAHKASICPVTKKLRKQVETNDQMNKFLQNFNDSKVQKIARIFQDELNFTINIAQLSWRTISQIADVLTSVQTHQLQAFPKISKGIYQKFKKAKQMMTWQVKTVNEDLQKIAVSKFFEIVKIYLQEVVLNKNSKKSLLIFSGHDSNLAYLLKALLLEKEVRKLKITYASHLILELHENKNKEKFFIKVKFNNKKYTLKNCLEGKKKCKLERFIEQINEYILENLAEICEDKIMLPYQ